MRSRQAVAARGQAATHAGLLRVLQTQRTPEELAADDADDKHDMLTRVAETQQAAHQRANKRALREKEQQQREQAVEAEKKAKKRAADRERMQMHAPQR